jgi:hypothetical protein
MRSLLADAIHMRHTPIERDELTKTPVVFLALDAAAARP